MIGIGSNRLWEDEHCLVVGVVSIGCFKVQVRHKLDLVKIQFFRNAPKFRKCKSLRSYSIQNCAEKDSSSGLK